jgi:hypothetical protein
MVGSVHRLYYVCLGLHCYQHQVKIGPALSGMSLALNTSVKYMSQMSKATSGLYCKVQAGEND